MTVINMTQTCKDTGIETFSRTRGGWMKLVEGYDNTQYGAYRFVGSNFVKVGNYDTDLQNGLYLDCSKPVIDGEKTEIMNLFKIHDGEVELINTIPKSNKDWTETFERDVAVYFESEDVTSVDILEVIRGMTCNKKILKNVGKALLQDEEKRIWLNERHFDAFMQEACVYQDNHSLHAQSVQKMAVEMFHNDFEAQKFFNYEISDEHQLRMLYSVIQNDSYFQKFYSDFKVEVETISEDYYTDMENLKELRDYNNNLLSVTGGGAIHDVAHWYSFRGRFANTKMVYIVIPNVPNETIKVQRFELHL